MRRDRVQAGSPPFGCIQGCGLHQSQASGHKKAGLSVWLASPWSCENLCAVKLRGYEHRPPGTVGEGGWGEWQNHRDKS